MNYQERKLNYDTFYTLGCLAVNMENKFALIACVCFLTHQARKKAPNATCLQVIKKVLGDKAEQNSSGMLETVAIICEDFMKGQTEFSTFGFKSAKEMMLKIQEVFHTELPFENPYKDDLPF